MDLTSLKGTDRIGAPDLGQIDVTARVQSSRLRAVCRRAEYVLPDRSSASP